MARVFALTRSAPQLLSLADLPRSMVVIGCALALIFAGRPLPF